MTFSRPISFSGDMTLPSTPRYTRLLPGTSHSPGYKGGRRSVPARPVGHSVALGLSEAGGTDSVGGPEDNKHQDQDSPLSGRDGGLRGVHEAMNNRMDIYVLEITPRDPGR